MTFLLSCLVERYIDNTVLQQGKGNYTGLNITQIVLPKSLETALDSISIKSDYMYITPIWKKGISLVQLHIMKQMMFTLL